MISSHHQASMRRDVFMWHSGRYPNRSSFSRLRAIIGLRTSESQHLPTKYETDFRYRQRPGRVPVIGANVIVKRDDKRSNHRARWRFPTGSSGKRYLRDQLYRLYDAKYPDKRKTTSRARLWSGATQQGSLPLGGVLNNTEDGWPVRLPLPKVCCKGS